MGLERQAAQPHSQTDRYLVVVFISAANRLVFAFLCGFSRLPPVERLPFTGRVATPPLFTGHTPGFSLARAVLRWSSGGFTGGLFGVNG